MLMSMKPPTPVAMTNTSTTITATTGKRCSLRAACEGPLRPVFDTCLLVLMPVVVFDTKPVFVLPLTREVPRASIEEVVPSRP